MATRALKRPRDTIQLAKLIGDIATGTVEDKTDDGKDPEAVKRGSLGGKVGGKARAVALSPAKRARIAQRAAAARWKKR